VISSIAPFALFVHSSAVVQASGYLGYADYSRFESSTRAEETGLSADGKWGKGGAGLLIVSADLSEVLLVKRSTRVLDPLVWGITGGARRAVEGGLEDALPCALHETGEELGGLPRGKVSRAPYVHRSGAFTFETFVLVVDQEERERFLPQLNYENTEWRWVKLEELETLPIHAGVREVLEKHSFDQIARDVPDLFEGARAPTPFVVEPRQPSPLEKRLAAVAEVHREMVGVRRSMDETLLKGLASDPSTIAERLRRDAARMDQAAAKLARLGKDAPLDERELYERLVGEHLTRAQGLIDALAGRDEEALTKAVRLLAASRANLEAIASRAGINSRSETSA
jgi:hypothetical protein